MYEVTVAYEDEDFRMSLQVVNGVYPFIRLELKSKVSKKLIKTARLVFVEVCWELAARGYKELRALPHSLAITALITGKTFEVLKELDGGVTMVRWDLEDICDV